jgi:type VII secretion-associated serine protease mycosin
MYNYPGNYPGNNQNYNGYNGYYGYPYPPIYPPRPRRRRGGFIFFLLLSALVVGAAYLTTQYIEGRGGFLPITQPGQPAAGTTDDGNNFGFRIRPNDPLVDQQYALQRLNASSAWKLTQGSSNVVVAVIDTGVDASHPDLQGKLVKGYDFVDGDTTPDDTVGHGTFVASLIAANSNDQLGISGIAPDVKIMPLKVMSRDNNGSSVRVAQAIRYAADNGAKVINMSLGSPTPSRSIKSAIDYAVSKGVTVVAAAGNEGDAENDPNYPASFANVISVGATGSRDTVAYFSNHNDAVTVTAPGVNVLGARSQVNQICRPYKTSDYCVASGTSFAAPYVAGVAALMISENPNLSPAQVKTLLEKSATDLGAKGYDQYYGYGRVDAGKAVQLAEAA